MKQVEIRLKKDQNYLSDIKIESPELAVQHLLPELVKVKEPLVVQYYLNAHLQPIGCYICSYDYYKNHHTTYLKHVLKGYFLQNAYQSLQVFTHAEDKRYLIERRYQKIINAPVNDLLKMVDCLIADKNQAYSLEKTETFKLSAKTNQKQHVYDRINQHDVEKESKVFLKTVKQTRNSPFQSLGQALEKIKNAYCDVEREQFIVATIDQNQNIINYAVASIGNQTSNTVPIASIMRLCLLSNADQVVCFHNHPSGVLTPSKADVAVTEHLVDTLQLFDIKMIDHFIVNYKGQCFSILENKPVQLLDKFQNSIEKTKSITRGRR